MKLFKISILGFLIILSSSVFSQDRQNAKLSTHKITFMELGSVRCIPCQKKEVVMKNIKKKYGNQVKVVCHDVWTKDGRPFGEKYHIKVIPTQIFFDNKGKEYYSHEGYFPENELIKIINLKLIKNERH